ncbi:NF-kappa-B inhibitor cactus isoform X2 [Lutzomyia longipalpis]|nr:NF-kappa-B inhibitor cactus isoform X2 [Lutzomyia longipalpis]
MSSEQCMSLSEIQSDLGKSSNISGPQAPSRSSQEDQQHRSSSKKITNTSSALDSGVITDSGVASCGEMILDREVNDNVSEWFCNLNLNSQPINNLSGQKSAKRERSVDVTKSQACTDVPAVQEPWEVYYLQNSDGDTHLHLAILDGHVDVAKALIRMNPYPCLLDIQNDFFQTPLHLAVIVGQYSTVRHLILAGAEPTIRDYKGNTPLHLACEKGDLACVRALTVPIAMTEIQDVFRTNSSHTESSSKKKRNSPSIQLPGDLDMRNYDGENCVHLAARGRHVDILRHLMWCGADINAKEGKSGETPLHIAVGQEDEQLVNFLVTECPKINLEICTYGGMTAYQFAAINRNQILMKNLARGGAEPLTPPESDYDTESDSDESQMVDLFGSPGYFQKFNGAKAINVA